MPEPIFMKLGMYIMAPEAISTGYFINSSHQSVSVCLFVLSLLGKGMVKRILPFVARQRLCKLVSPATNICNSKRIVRRVIFYAVSVSSKESLRVCLFIPLSLLGKNSVNKFPRQRIKCWCSCLL
jgi:hypothetical protein